MTGHAFIFYSKCAKIRRMHKNDQFKFFFSTLRAQKLLEQSLWARQYEVWTEWWLEREEDGTVFRLPAVLHLCSYLQASRLCSARSRNSTCNIARVFVSFQNAQVTHWLTDCVSDWWLGGVDLPQHGDAGQTRGGGVWMEERKIDREKWKQ